MTHFSKECRVLCTPFFCYTLNTHSTLEVTPMQARGARDREPRGVQRGGPRSRRYGEDPSDVQEDSNEGGHLKNRKARHDPKPASESQSSPLNNQHTSSKILKLPLPVNESAPVGNCINCGKVVLDGWYGRWGDGGVCGRKCDIEQAVKPKVYAKDP